MSTDYPSSRRGAAIGARLRRLSERIDREAEQLYAAAGVPFEQRWFGVLDRLAQHRGMTVGDLAAALGISHAAVSQTRAGLEARGLVASAADPADARRRILVLTPAGAELTVRLRPLWDALDAAALELNREAGDAVAAIDRLEAALDRQGLAARVGGRLPA